VIQGQEFNNEVVDLDGKQFLDCIFTNVTFKYNGTAPFEMHHIQLNGTRWIDTDNERLARMLALLKALGMIDPHFDTNKIKGADLPNVGSK
jgi:hypothetical protein